MLSVKKTVKRYQRILLRSVVTLCVVVSPFLASGPAHAAVTFVNDYPDFDAAPCPQFGGDSWCKGDPLSHQSSRGYDYNNCTDGAAYWVAKYIYTGIGGWGDAINWDNAASSSYTVLAGTTRDIEPGDIAQSEDGGNGHGHVGFVTSVTKNADGTVASFTTAELNKADTGEYSPNTYSTRNSLGNFGRGGNYDWDHFIDVNGSGKGLGNEAWPIADADSDGIPDAQDQCPAVPGIAANNGCPANNPNVVIDVNGDGKADLLHIWSGGINTWRANGDGTYAVSNPFKPSPSYDMMSGLAWKFGDVNGDGKTDVLHIWSGGVNTWLSNGDGTYAVTSTYIPSGYNMTAGFDWEMGDVNGDGKTDLLHLWAGGVNTWLSNGNGTYAVSSPYAPTGYNMTSGIGWKLGDFNGDGKADLLHLWSGGANLWASNGNGTYVVTNPYKPVGYNMASGLDWKVGDVNGDGKTDLLHLWSGGVNTWLSNGNGTYTVTNPYLPSGYSMTGGLEFKVGDFNGDGKTDLLHLWAGGANTWASNGNGTFVVTNPYKPSGYSMTGGFEFTAGDVNHDGKTDLLHLWNGGANTWLSNGNGIYNVTNTYLPFAGYGMTGGAFYPSY